MAQETQTPSMRLVQLYALLARGRRAYSLKRLAQTLHCSKQSILRGIEQLQRIEGVELESWREGRERQFRIGRRRGMRDVQLTPEVIQRLLLCYDIVRHVLPKPLQDEIGDTLGADGLEPIAEPLGKGLIDYTPFAGYIESIQSAMHGKRLCRIGYAPRLHEPAKTYVAAPLGILAFREALYLRCVVCDEKGTPLESKARTFAIQRIRGLDILRQRFTDLPDLEDAGAFGFPMHEPIQVRVAFTEAAATYVAERTWSEGQWIRKRKGGGIILTFTTTSRQEVLSWVLSFGKEAELLEPKDLRQALAATLQEAASTYSK